MSTAALARFAQSDLLTRKTRYDREFLLQFCEVCTGRPSGIPHVDPMWFILLIPPTTWGNKLRHQIAEAAAPDAQWPQSSSSPPAAVGGSHCEVTPHLLGIPRSARPSASASSTLRSPTAAHDAPNHTDSTGPAAERGALHSASRRHYFPSSGSCLGSPTEVGGTGSDVAPGSPPAGWSAAQKYPPDPPLDELDKRARDARMDVLESHLAAVEAEAAYIRVELQRLREAWRM